MTYNFITPIYYKNKHPLCLYKTTNTSGRISLSKNICKNNTKKKRNQQYIKNYTCNTKLTTTQQQVNIKPIVVKKLLYNYYNLSQEFESLIKLIQDKRLPIVKNLLETTTFAQTKQQNKHDMKKNSNQTLA